METPELAELRHLRGACSVQRELLLALIESRPDRKALTAHALGVAAKLHNMALGSTEPDSTLAGIEAEAGYWRRRMAQWGNTAGS